MQPFTFFLSYRRADTAPVALLLKYEIEKRLQYVRVVVDVSDIHPGQAFPERIRSLIDTSHATLVLIGPAWMPSSSSDPSVWSTDGDDWVRAEIAYSFDAPLKLELVDRYGLSSRAVIPLFIGMQPDFRRFKVPAEIAQLTQCHAQHILHETWPSHIGPLIDGIATSISQDLKKRPDADTYPQPDRNKARTQPMPDDELRQILTYEDYDGWYIDNFGNAETIYIVKTFKFRHFNHAADFMRMVSDYCRVLDHHPEWRNVFNHVTVSLTTWDARRRVTIYDLNLALYMNKAAAVAARGKT